MSKTLTDLRHTRSEKDFPYLSLLEDEYVVLSIARSRLGLIIVWFTEIVLFLLLTLALIVFDHSAPSQNFAGTDINSLVRVVIFILYGVLLLSGLIGTKLYLSEKLFITNRRAIMITHSYIFSSSTNVIELSRIEDVSFHQNGIIDAVFHMGTIRMSTVGDEHTYTFKYVDTPTDEMETISRLVHENRDPKKSED